MMLPTSFSIMMSIIMLIITVLSYFMSTELFGESVRKNSRRKLLVINIITIIGMLAFYPKLLDYSYGAMVSQIVVMWYVMQIFLVILSILVKIFRIGLEKATDKKIDGSRRRFLHGLIWIPAVSGTLYGGLYESRHIEFDEVEIDCTNNPKLNGLKIAQLSDVHLGTFFSVKEFYQVLQQIAQKGPDMLVLTGDIFDSIKLNDEAIKVLNVYTRYFPYGVYFCWGNHEHMRNFEHIKEALSKTNVKVLTNESIKVLSGDKPLYLLGVDFVDERGTSAEEVENLAKTREAYIQAALKDVPENAYKILLAHHSIFIDEAFKHNIDLTLSGHTHGGQFGFMGISLVPVFKYMRGKFTQNNCIAYVNRGAGSWFPYRIGCSPEVTIFNFKNK